MRITESAACGGYGPAQVHKALTLKEALMKKFCILAALLMATTSAHAGNSISFEIDGHKIHIEAPKNCDQLSCLKISGFDLKGFNSKRFDDDNDVAAKSEPAAQNPAPAPTAAAPQAPAATAPASTTVATTSPAPAANDDVTPPARPAASTTAPKPVPVAAAPVQAAASPVGVWATEENKGNVRIEPCGESLCGYAVKTGEKILINMKPQDTKWIGHIHDPDSGRNYDSTIAMKGANSLRVQGCAFGGMFCGGQIWNRVS
jgi:uncharacterized protein (DUF2147 family)